MPRSRAILAAAGDGGIAGGAEIGGEETGAVGFAAGAEADLALAAPRLFGPAARRRHGFASLATFRRGRPTRRIDFERNLIGLQLGQRFIRRTRRRVA